MPAVCACALFAATESERVLRESSALEARQKAWQARFERENAELQAKREQAERDAALAKDELQHAHAQRKAVL